MNEEKIEELAKWAATTLNGGNWGDRKFYQYKHKEAWMNMIRQLVEKINTPTQEFSMDLIYDLRSIVGVDAEKECYDNLETPADKIAFLEAVKDYCDTRYWEKNPREERR